MDLNIDAAVEFLERWSTDQWVLTAIPVNGTTTHTGTFTEAEEVRSWMHANKNSNLYFHVNPTRGKLKKKARRDDIKQLAWLHVDVDPRTGEPINEERVRIKALLTDKRDKNIPEPTCIIFSGGGFQGFWRLEEPITIENEEHYEKLANYNRQLEIAFGGDNTHNIDRIMRLPGSINWPTKTKVKKGREPRLAEVVWFRDHTYPLGSFKEAPRLQSSTDGIAQAKIQVDVGGNVQRIMDLDELEEYQLDSRLKRIIGQGFDPDGTTKSGDNSRSGWLFDCVVNLVRKNVPDEIIYSIITDPEWPISESVLDYKSNADRYAKRQIARGKEYAIDPNLVRMNEQYACVAIEGKFRIMEEQPVVGEKYTNLVLYSKGDFVNFFENQTVMVNDKPMNLAKWWLSQPHRSQYTGIAFLPGQEVNGPYNLWQGFAVEPKPGDCSKFLNHIKENLCSGDDEHYEYLMNWLARVVQHPDIPGEVAIVLQGGRGTGKGFFTTAIGSLFGRHYLQVSNSEHLTGRFNSHLSELVLLFADEAFFANDKRHTSVLKTLITERRLPIERKGIDVTSERNCIHLIMASNENHVVPAGHDERRFFCLKVSEGHKQDAAYFAALRHELDNGGRETILWELMNRDLSDFDVRSVPQTEALQSQKQMTLEPTEQWWYNKLCDGVLLPEGDRWPTVVVKDALMETYYTEMDQVKAPGWERKGPSEMTRFLKGMTGGYAHVTKKRENVSTDIDGNIVSTGRRPAWQLPNLEDCRKLWIEQYGETNFEEEDD